MPKLGANSVKSRRPHTLRNTAEDAQSAPSINPMSGLDIRA